MWTIQPPHLPRVDLEIVVAAHRSVDHKHESVVRDRQVVFKGGVWRQPDLGHQHRDMIENRRLECAQPSAVETNVEPWSNMHRDVICMQILETWFGPAAVLRKRQP